MLFYIQLPPPPPIIPGVWMLSPLLQTLEIKLQNDTRCSEILMGAYDPATKLCFENVDSGACSVGKLKTKFILFTNISVQMKNRAKEKVRMKDTDFLEYCFTAQRNLLLGLDFLQFLVYVCDNLHFQPKLFFPKLKRIVFPFFSFCFH